MLNVQVIKHGLPAVVDISTGRQSRSAASQRRLILYGSPAMKIVLTQSSSSRNSIVTLAATRRRPRGRAGSWGSWLWVDIVSTPPPPSPPLPPALASRSEIGGRVLQQPLFFKQQQLLLIRIDRDSCFFPSAFWSVTPAQWTRGKQRSRAASSFACRPGRDHLNKLLPLQ
jgi:hypothetical protein